MTEPNNASPLNSDAAALWDTPDGKMPHRPYVVFTLTMHLAILAFRAQLMKLYRPPSDTSA